MDLPSESLDLVTCQTLLIHVKDRGAVLKEFLRVLKPGGLCLCAEPNNLTAALVQGVSRSEATLEEVFLEAQFELALAYGKAQAGQGKSYGVETIPDEMQTLGFTDVRAYLSDLVPRNIYAQGEVFEDPQDEFIDYLKTLQITGFTQEDWDRYQQLQTSYQNRLRSLTRHRRVLDIYSGQTYLFSGRKP